MKTRDRVATALVPREAEAIIEQARRRQRRRRRVSPASFSVSCLTRAPSCAAWLPPRGSRPSAAKCAAACG